MQASDRHSTSAPSAEGRTSNREVGRTVGVYEHEDRARQLIRFDDMHIDKRGFTDIDAVMEWRDRAWLIFEVKTFGKDVPLGQRIALERFVKDASACGKYAVAAVVEHNVVNPNMDIYLRDCLVKSLYVTYEYRWRPPKQFMTAHQLMRSVIGLVDSEVNRKRPYGVASAMEGSCNAKGEPTV